MSRNISTIYTTGAITDQMLNDQALWPDEVSVGEVVYPPGGTLGLRLQRNLQLVLIHTGRMQVWVDGVMRTAEAGTVAILLPGHEERFEFAQETETWHTWLHAFVPTLPAELHARMRRLPWPLPLSAPMAELMRSALTLCKTPLGTAVPVLKAITAQMMWRYIGEGELHGAVPSAIPHPALEDARYFIHAHLHEPITLAMIAEAASVSPGHLIRLFRDELKLTPMAYVWQQRVAAGIGLLEQTGLSIGTIAERCGFQNSFHFSRRVRHATGAPPLEVRRRAWGR
jgi:AraC family transcriptional regulator of arabinose operon